MPGEGNIGREVVKRGWMNVVMVTLMSVDAAADALFPPSSPSSPQGAGDATPQATATSTKGRALCEAPGGRGIMKESHPLVPRREECRLMKMAGVPMVSAPLVVKVDVDVVLPMLGVTAAAMETDGDAGLTATGVVISAMAITVARSVTAVIGSVTLLARTTVIGMGTVGTAGVTIIGMMEVVELGGARAMTVTMLAMAA